MDESVGVILRYSICSFRFQYLMTLADFISSITHWRLPWLSRLLFQLSVVVSQNEIVISIIRNNARLSFFYFLSIRVERYRNSHSNRIPNIENRSHFAKITDGRTSPDLVLARLENGVKSIKFDFGQHQTIILPRTPLDM